MWCQNRESEIVKTDNDLYTSMICIIQTEGCFKKKNDNIKLVKKSQELNISSPNKQH
jgi:hypothetical protein